MDNQSMSHRNRSFDFYKFVFSCIIFVLHIRKYGNFENPNCMFNGGYLAVEFFFIVSGFFMMDGIQKIHSGTNEGIGSSEKLTIKYFFHRYLRLMPQYWTSILLLLFVNKLLNPQYSILKSALKGMPGIFGLQILLGGSVNGHLWFVSGLLLAGTLIYYLILKHRDLTLYILLPFGMMIYLGYVQREIGYIDLTNNEKLYLSAFFRAFFEIGFGCIIYHIFISLNSKRWNPILMTIIELGITVVAIIVMYRTRRDYKDFIMVFLLGGLVLVLAFNQGYLTKILDNKFSAFLGSISYPIYINQNAFQQIALQKFSGYSFGSVLFISLGVTIVYSIAITMLFKKIAPSKRKVKKQLVSDK